MKRLQCLLQVSSFTADGEGGPAGGALPTGPAAASATLATPAQQTEGAVSSVLQVGPGEHATRVLGVVMSRLILQQGGGMLHSPPAQGWLPPSWLAEQPGTRASSAACQCLLPVLASHFTQLC